WARWVGPAWAVTGRPGRWAAASSGGPIGRATSSAWTDRGPAGRRPAGPGQSACVAGLQLAGFSATSTTGTITTAATTPSAEKLVTSISGQAAKDAIAQSRLDSASTPPLAETRDV